MQPLSQILRLLFTEKQMCQCVQRLNDQIVAVYEGLTLILAPVHVLQNEAQHPHYAQQMVNMLVGDNDVMHVHPVKACGLETL